METAVFMLGENTSSAPAPPSRAHCSPASLLWKRSGSRWQAARQTPRAVSRGCVGMLLAAPGEQEGGWEPKQSLMIVPE